MASLMLDSKAVYKCEYCHREFDDGRKLGGHISKAHLKEKSSKKSIPFLKNESVAN